MKKLSALIVGLAAVLTVTAITACGKSGGSSPAPVPPNTVAAIPPGVRVGFVAQNTKMDRLLPNSGSSYVLEAGMRNVLKYAMRTCDRNHSDGGLADCTAWLNGFNDIVLFANGSQASKVQLIIRSFPDTTCYGQVYCGNYWYSMPSFNQFLLGLFGINTINPGQIYNPLIMDMTIWPINDSRGFELRGYAPGNDLVYGSGNLLFQFQVANGKLEDMAWDYRLVFNGEVAASGRMVRCARNDCGLTWQ